MGKYINSNPNDEVVEDGDDFSEMSWKHDPFETDEDYQDRINDLEDLLEHNNN